MPNGRVGRRGLRGGWLLAGLAAAAGGARAAAPPPPDPARLDTTHVVSEVTVLGHRTPGAIAPDDTPMVQLGVVDIGGLGARDIADLLAALRLETSGADGSAPVVLLNGVRISGLASLRDLPAEALQGVEIYSGDTAVRFGYGAQQRVVNLVLKPRYADIAAEAEGAVTTDGGAAFGRGKLGFDKIASGRRLSLNATYEHTDWLLESQRPIEGGVGRFETLTPASDHLVASGVYAATFGATNLSLDANVDPGRPCGPGAQWDRARLDVVPGGPRRPQRQPDPDRPGPGHGRA